MSKLRELLNDQEDIIKEENVLVHQQEKLQKQIIDILSQMKDQQKQEQEQESQGEGDGEGEGEGDGENGEGKGKGKSPKGEQGESGEPSEDGEGEPESGDLDEDGDDGYDGPRVLDNHELWQTGTDDPEDQKMTLQNVLNQAKEDCIRQYGSDSIPLNVLEMLDQTLAPARVSWEKLLRQFIGRKMSFERAGTRKRPNRRLGLKALGKTFKQGPKTLFAVDCSGSVSDDMYLKIMGEIKGASKNFPDKVDTIFFDTQVSGVTPLGQTQKMPRRQFSGGTNFQPVIDFAIEYKPDLLIILTDGVAPIPTKPSCPVLWAIIGTDNPNLYGLRIVIPDDADTKKVSKTLGSR